MLTWAFEEHRDSHKICSVTERSFYYGKRLNMLDYAYQNDVIMKNPCNGMVKSDIGITMNLYVHTTEDEKHKEIEKIAASLKVV